MAQRIEQFVPDEKEFWHYHEPSGMVLMNDPEYGWIAVASSDIIELMMGELKDTMTAVQEQGYTDPGDVSDDESIASYMERAEDED